jgi:hypothetical protein
VVEGKRNNVADVLSRDWHLGRRRTHLSPALSFPRTDAGKFPNSTATQRDQLLDDLLAAAASRERAITGASHDDGARSWGRWQKWCESVGCDDLYLDQCSQFEQNLLLGAFAMAVREGWFSLNRTDALVEGTVRGAISHELQAFRESGRQNPIKDADNMLSVLLSRQFRAYSNDDPKEVQQKALPFIVLEELAKRRVSELDKGVSQLTICGGFFACRSCEYLKLPRREMKRTKQLCLRNIRFFLDGRLLSTPSANLEFAESVAVTFEMQKNEQKHETIIHGRTDDPVLCPVKQWAHLVNRIWSYQGTTENTPVSTVWRNDRREQITSRQVITSLRAACATIGSARLGFEPDKIGTHSLHSGAAMEMYLAGVPVYTIMLIGRWSSDAFLRYICRQVEQFSKDVSHKMITHRSF